MVEATPYLSMLLDLIGEIEIESLDLGSAIFEVPVFISQVGSDTLNFDIEALYLLLGPSDFEVMIHSLPTSWCCPRSL